MTDPIDHGRRALLQGGALLPALALAAPVAAAYGTEAGSEIRVIIPQASARRFDKGYEWRLARATLDYLEQRYGTGNLPVWNRPFATIELEKRLVNIVHWVVQGVDEHRASWFVDPAWVISQIMAESYFYEFAVSSSLALGICQFIQPTAGDYDLLCAGSRPAHHRPPYREPELAGLGERFYALREEKRAYRSAHASELIDLDDLVLRLRRGDSASILPALERHAGAKRELERFDERIDEARDGFRRYLEANLEGRDLFNDRDVGFLLGFDERLTYRKPTSSMVKMLAWALKNRQGNILAAASGYNAGLGRTKDDGYYGEYGRIPALEETTKYLSHIVVNHYEIGMRMGG